MLKNTIEALLFAAGDGISEKDIIAHFIGEYNEKQLKKAISELRSEYSGNRGIVIIEYNGKLQMQSNTLYGETLADILTPIKEKQLSKTLLEVLAIIAYKQPITRGEIELIRNGVSPDYACQMLAKYDLIEEVGRKIESVGRPIQYGTTEEFLRKFGLSSLEDLPDYDELIDKIRTNFDKYYKNQDENLFRTKDTAGLPDDEFFDETSDAVPDFLEGEEVVDFSAEEVAADTLPE